MSVVHFRVILLLILSPSFSPHERGVNCLFSLIFVQSFYFNRFILFLESIEKQLQFNGDRFEPRYNEQSRGIGIYLRSEIRPRL